MAPPVALKTAARPPGFGEPAPFFEAETDGVASYALQVAAGRWLVLMAFGSLGHPASAAAHEAALRAGAVFNEQDAAFFGVSVDPADRHQRGLRNAEAGWRYFWDFDRRVSRLLGLADAQHLRPAVFLIDRSYRVVMAEDVERTPQVLDRLRSELAREREREEAPYAPVLTLERVLEPELCQALKLYFEHVGGAPSGFMIEQDGLTTARVDPRFKRRSDVTIEDPALLRAVRERLEARLFPMVKRAFNWQATEIERFIVARYDAEDAGFFSAHRDDMTPGTAHRKFAVTLNLNAEDYAGGELRFPEFGRRTYRSPTGGATVFCCSLLHEVTPVTRGSRYAVLPFLYDEAGARLRKANLSRVAGSEGTRKARRAAGRR